MLTDAVAKRILKTYGEAWVKQDPEKILTIFDKKATYQEGPFSEPFKGHAEIKAYWQQKVCREQSNITFKLLSHYISGDTLVAEWNASFNSNVKQCKVNLCEVALMEIKNEKITSLREYWDSEKTPI